jgi:N-acetylglucosaminyldiphosphoundecaprenol N-acetyl-beta-D-mannosaminyltransferase
VSFDTITVPNSLTIFGVRVDDVTEDEALAMCERFIAEGQRIVATPNPEIVMTARDDRELRQALAHADLAIPDGGGLLLAARLWHQPFRAQVRGSDLTNLLLARAATQGWRVFLLGGGPGVANAAAAAIKTRWPAVQIVGTYAGLADEANDAATRAAVAAAGRVDILLVAYGGSRQERWMVRNLPALDVGVALGIGGTLDFLSGRVRRAPLWLRRARLEWLFRLAIQPWRWRRQLSAARFFPLIVLHTPRERQRTAERSSRRSR